jgi:RNA polymerase II C-terminal domain phosphatase-like 3/4
MGDAPYAAGMAALLDPAGDLFRGRVASSADAGASMTKDLAPLLGADELVAVLDDTAAVWPRHAANLVQVERYAFFPGCAARFGRGASLLERGEDESGESGAMAAALRVLRAAHARFFAEPEPAAGGAAPAAGGAAPAAGGAAPPPRDLRRHLADLRAEVLAGVVVLLSRVVPRGGDPAAHPFARLAAQFGARVVAEPGPEVTHCVAAGETEKTRWARARPGVHVVSLDWLWASVYAWTRADEARFALAPGGEDGGGGGGAPAAAATSPEAERATALLAAGGGNGAAAAPPAP